METFTVDVTKAQVTLSTYFENHRRNSDGKAGWVSAAVDSDN